MSLTLIQLIHFEAYRVLCCEVWRNDNLPLSNTNLVHAMRFPASLLGRSRAELGAGPAGYGLRDLLAPFRPERIAQPGQS